MKIRRVQLMQLPPKCVGCGRGNTPDEPDTMEDFWALDLGVDIDWGDNCQLCKYCVMQLAAEGGYVSDEQLEEKEEEVKRLRVTIHDLKAEIGQWKQKQKRAQDRLAAVGVTRKVIRENKANYDKKKPKKKKAAA